MSWLVKPMQVGGQVTAGHLAALVAVHCRCRRSSSAAILLGGVDRPRPGPGTRTADGVPCSAGLRGHQLEQRRRRAMPSSGESAVAVARRVLDLGRVGEDVPGLDAVGQRPPVRSKIAPRGAGSSHGEPVWRRPPRRTPGCRPTWRKTSRMPMVANTTRVSSRGQPQPQRAGRRAAGGRRRLAAGTARRAARRGRRRGVRSAGSRGGGARRLGARPASRRARRGGGRSPPGRRRRRSRRRAGRPARPPSSTCSAGRNGSPDRVLAGGAPLLGAASSRRSARAGCTRGRRRCPGPAHRPGLPAGAAAPTRRSAPGPLAGPGAARPILAAPLSLPRPAGW